MFATIGPCQLVVSLYLEVFVLKWTNLLSNPAVTSNIKFHSSTSIIRPHYEDCGRNGDHPLKYIIS